MKIKRIIALMLTLTLLFSVIVSAETTPKLVNSDTINVKLYYPPKGENKSVEAIVPVRLSEKMGLEQKTLSMLLEKAYMPSTAFSSIPSGIKILSFSIDGKTAHVNFSSEFKTNITSSDNIADILDSILKTLFQFDSIDSVEFMCNWDKIGVINDWDLDMVYATDIFSAETGTLLQSPPNTNIFVPQIIPDSNPIIVIDPGHGGSEPGAISGTVIEAHINLAIALKLRDYLVGKGATVYMTRTTDTTVSLAARYNLANSKNADYFISVHNNSSVDESIHGPLVYYAGLHDTTTSKAIAGLIMDNFLVSRPSTSISKSPTISTGLLVLKYTNMSAVMTESGFISNDVDRAYLVSSSGQAQVAYDIYKAFRYWCWGV